MRTFTLIFILIISLHSIAQDIQLFQQFNGRVDYTAFGNTLNEIENGPANACTILTSSSANFSLETDQTILAAYLYWAGSGVGDLNVTLNGTSITAQRTFSSFLPSANLDYFAAFADITSQIQNEGNGNYTLSDLDLTQIIIDYCNNATNFGGWSVIVIYEDPDLPINQLNVFDGFEQISRDFPTISITLTNLETVDNSNSKVGFLAWEGDSGIAVDETLRLNGVTLSNEPLNPPNNAFNGTNSFTNSSELFNMDLDVYNVQGLINPGDQTAQIDLTTGQDLILVNNIITVLNNALPDATIQINNVEGSTACGDLDFTVDYTVFNTLGTDRLPPVNIGFFANNQFIAATQTTNFIEVGEEETGSFNFTLPITIAEEVELVAFVDYQNLITELDENNNEDSTQETALVLPVTDALQNIEICDVVGDEFFNLTEATQNLNPDYFLSFHITETDAQNNDNPIANPLNFENTINPQTIWVRVSNTNCFVIDSFIIEKIDCPLPDATIQLTDSLFACRQRNFEIKYTVFNTLGTASLPANTKIAFFIDNFLVALSQTQNNIPIGGFEEGALVLELPESTPNNFTLQLRVDDNGLGAGSVIELDEFNNENQQQITFGTIAPIADLPNLTTCDKGFERATFNFLDPTNGLIDIITANTEGEVTFYTTLENALTGNLPIPNPESFTNTSNPQTIYVRLENEVCFTTASFQLIIEKCEPIIFEGISPNNDGKNDVFNINYIIDVYPDFELKIYSRQGNLIYEGGQEEGLWKGIPNRGVLQRNIPVPVGTYFYVLILNDPQFPEPFLGSIYVNY